MKNTMLTTALPLGIALFQAIILPPALAGEVTEAWVHRYSHLIPGANDRGVKIVRDPSGDVIVGGATGDAVTGDDMLTIKYSGADGSVLWQRRYNGPGNGDDQISALALDASGNAVVAGISPGANGRGEIYVAKYAGADGAVLWEQRYNGPDNYNQTLAAATVDGAGNVLLTGSYVAPGDNGIASCYLAKCAAADGAVIWERRDKKFSLAALAADGNGNVIATGSSTATNGYPDYYTAKFWSADGALAWEQHYNGPGNVADWAAAVAVDGSGNALVTGSSINSGGWRDYYTAKYAAANGALIWQQRDRANPNGDANGTAVTVDVAGNVLVTGISYLHRYTVKYAASNGARLWSRVGPAGTPNIAADPALVAVDGSGNVIVSGGSGHDYYTAKYAAADGVVLWERTYDGPGNSEDLAYGVAVDSAGNVFVTGSSHNGIDWNWDFYSAKYSAVNGTPLWEQRYDGLQRGLSEARAVALDANGNVFVTGRSASRKERFSFRFDYYTAKYAVTDGALLWERRYNSPDDGDDQPAALAVDASGNAIVAGGAGTIKYLADGTPTWTNDTPFAKAVAVDVSGDVIVTGGGFTSKYAAANGALLWQTNGPGTALAVALDGTGNVVVTGHAPGTNFNFDYYTAKYASTDGSLLWETRYNGNPGMPEYFNGSVALAVDASGNVAVTGLSRVRETGYPDSFDFYTAKYAATNGALLWEKRYEGTGGDTRHLAQAIAVDTTGNVVVTGFSEDIERLGLENFYTAKYAAANGALLWEKRRATGSSQAGLTCVAVDAAGNVVVAGTAGGPGGSDDYYTAKYAAADGTLLWEKFYNDPANGRDTVGTLVGHDFDWLGVVATPPARQLALGPNGMVVVTGTSSYGLESELATVVYREALPPSLVLAPGGNALILSWSASAIGFTLQSTPNLIPPVTWLDVTNPPAVLDGQFTVTNPVSAPSQFFRLKKP